MAWIKFWCSQWLLSAGRFAFTPEEKSVWFDMLAMAGESANPGEIRYPDFANFSIRIAQETASFSAMLLKFHNASKIIWLPNENRIIILNWDKFQSGKMSHCQATKDVVQKYEECGHHPLQENDVKNCTKTMLNHTNNSIKNSTETASPIDKIRLDKIYIQRDAQNGAFSASKKNEEINPEIKVFLDWFVSRYESEVGAKYFVNGGKDGTLIKRLLKLMPLADLQDAADLMFADEWIHTHSGFTIGVLSNNINRFLAKRAGGACERQYKIG